jgi:hypothetical protein
MVSAVALFENKKQIADTMASPFAEVLQHVDMAEAFLPADPTTA